MELLKEYEGHKVIITNGYYDVYYPEHPNARKNGSVMLQVIIASKIIGRPLKENEVVHHVDENKLNNSPNNLMIFNSQSDHSRYHKMLNSKEDYVLYSKNKIYFCTMADDFFGKRKIYRQVIYKNGKTEKRISKICPKCGKLMSIGGKICKECRAKSNRIVERPNRNELKNLIRNCSFVQIAKKYNVTDNTIRKWCKYYNLPYRSNDIKKISSKEWKNI